ncbi:MAG: HAD family hydrolase [Actinomycetota bacterium]|nr:HAD family hydrolase [Actinomycetota bacterium]
MKSKHVAFEGVTFDLWNTLLVSEPGGIEVRQLAWQKVIDERNLSISSDLLLSVLEMLPVRFDVEWRAGRQYTAKEALEDAFNVFGEKITDEDREVFSETFDQASFALKVDVIEGAEEVLAYLAGKGIKTAIVSDTSLSAGRHLRFFLTEFGIAPYVTYFAFSDEVGVYKPDAKIFMKALGGMGDVRPFKAAHVGDLKRTDVLGARNIGMTSVRFRGANDDQEDELEADFVIDHLSELPSMLNL